MSRKSSTSHRRKASRLAKKKSPTSASRRSTCSTRKTTAAPCSRWRGVAAAAAAVVAPAAAAAAAADAAVAVALPAQGHAVRPGVTAASARLRPFFRLRIKYANKFIGRVRCRPGQLPSIRHLHGLLPTRHRLLSASLCASNTIEELRARKHCDLEQRKALRRARIPKATGETCVLTP